MKSQLKNILPILSISILFSCGGLTESQARTQLEAEADRLAALACECIDNVEGTDDAAFEAKIACQGEGQTNLFNFAREKGIDEAYPKLNEEMKDTYIRKVDVCLD